jgi:putative tryptophan/tyrosine transport system substrate-binding protein
MIVNPDPIGMGLVQSLAHPGGNVTGLTTMDWDIYGKRIEILRQAVPGLGKAALLLSGGNPVYKRGSPWATKVMADSALLGVELSFAETEPNDIEATVVSVFLRGCKSPDCNCP